MAPVEIHEVPPVLGLAGLATKPRAQWAHCYAPTAALDFRAINSCRSEMSWTPSINHRPPSSGDKTNNSQPNVQPRVKPGATKHSDTNTKHDSTLVLKTGVSRRCWQTVWKVKSSTVHEVCVSVQIEVHCNTARSCFDSFRSAMLKKNQINSLHCKVLNVCRYRGGKKNRHRSWKRSSLYFDTYIRCKNESINNQRYNKLSKISQFINGLWWS